MLLFQYYFMEVTDYYKFLKSHTVYTKKKKLRQKKILLT